MHELVHCIDTFGADFDAGTGQHWPVRFLIGLAAKAAVMTFLAHAYTLLRIVDGDRALAIIVGKFRNNEKTLPLAMAAYVAIPFIDRLDIAVAVTIPTIDLVSHGSAR